MAPQKIRLRIFFGKKDYKMKIFSQFRELSRGELALWLFSAGVTAAAYILSGGGGTMALISSLTGVTALIFVAKGMVFGQILTVVFSVLSGVISCWEHYYGEMITYLGMTAPIAAAAVISWAKHPYRDTKQVEVARLTWKKLLLLYGAGLPVTLGFYFMLKALGNAQLMFSTLSVYTSFTAAGLTFLRSPLYGLGYAANDIVLIILWWTASAGDISNAPMVCCFAMFLANDVYGFVNWRRIERGQLSEVRG